MPAAPFHERKGVKVGKFCVAGPCRTEPIRPNQGESRWIKVRHLRLCGRRTRLWASAHAVSDYAMASVGGEVARNNRDDCGM